MFKFTFIWCNGGNNCRDGIRRIVSDKQVLQLKSEKRSLTICILTNSKFYVKIIPENYPCMPRKSGIFIDFIGDMIYLQYLCHVQLTKGIVCYIYITNGHCNNPYKYLFRVRVVHIFVMSYYEMSCMWQISLVGWMILYTIYVNK